MAFFTILAEEGIITGNMLVIALKTQNNVLLMRTKTLPDNICVDKVSSGTNLPMVH